MNQANTSWNTSHPCMQHKVFSRRSILPTGNLAKLVLARADLSLGEVQPDA